MKTHTIYPQMIYFWFQYYWSAGHFPIDYEDNWNIKHNERGSYRLTEMVWTNGGWVSKILLTITIILGQPLVIIIDDIFKIKICLLMIINGWSWNTRLGNFGYGSSILHQILFLQIGSGTHISISLPIRVYLFLPFVHYSNHCYLWGYAVCCLL